jgi:signal transduction histidine kinase/ligand-binding sensor domain-containing protein
MGKAHIRGRSLVVAGLVMVGLWLVLPASVFALDPTLDVSQYAHKGWRVSEGFSKGAIFAITQTPDGYLWLGTEFGLLRFDGVRAVSWQPAMGQNLPSSSVASLLVAQDGTLWIGTWKGLASWKDGKLTQYPQLAGLLVMTLLQDREGTVWAGGYAYEPPGKLCSIQNGTVHCNGEDGTLGNGAMGLYEDSKGRLWVGVSNGLWQWRPGPPHFYGVSAKPYGIQGLAEDHDGSLLIAMRGRLARLVDGQPVTAYPYPAAARQLPSGKMLCDRDGSLWTTTPQGLVHIHQGTSDKFAQSDGLSSDSLTGFFEDREGNIWVATSKGLDRFSASSVATFSEHEGLSSSTDASVLTAKNGSIWFSTHGRLSRWDKGQITIYHSPGTRTEPISSGAEGRVREVTLAGLPKHDLASLFQDDDGRIWVAANGGVGYIQNERFVSVGSVPGGVVYAIAGDAQGNLWISNLQDGLFHLLHGSLVQQIAWATLGRNDFATALTADRSEGGVWLGFSKGGLAYFRDGQIRASYTAADGLGEGRVGDLRFGSRGTLWAATQGGLSRVRDGHVVTLTSENGLPCEGVHWSMEDDDHSVWLYTPCGLVRIARSELDAWVSDPRSTVQTMILGASDGVRPLGDFGSGPLPRRASKSADGKIWFSTFEGFSVVDPRHIPFNKLPPPVHIEQITADGTTYDPAQGLHVPSRVQHIDIDYTALSLVAPEKNQFRFKLEGYDHSWRDVGNRRQAFYTNLPPRNYRFRVIACNNTGVWNEAGATLDFVIPPAWYQTNWFRVACAVAFLAILWGMYELRIRQLAAQFNMRLEERVNERTRIARDLHDTMLQTFQGVLLKFHGVTYMLDRPEAALKTLEETIVQAQQAVNEGREAVQGLRSSTVIANDLARAFATLGEELAAKQDSHNPVAFQVEVEGETRDLHPILRDEVYRIGCEAMRNAFQHSGAARIEVRIHYDDRHFRVCIRDNGKGIDPTVLDAGVREGHYGLPGMHERAKLAGGRLVVRSEVNSGTEAEIIIPAARAYAKSRSPRRSAFLRRGA